MGKPATQDDSPPELIELIQFYALRRDALKLTVESALRQRGWVCVDEGDVVRVETAGGKLGLEAFVELVSWDQPRVVQLERGEIFEDFNVDTPIAQFLMETYWQAQEHEPTDPPQEPLPTGLEEETVVGPQDFRPPDGLTKAVLDHAQKFSDLEGFIAVALFSSRTGECIDVLGHRIDFQYPPWVPEMVVEQAEENGAEHAMFIHDDHIDVLVSPFGEDPVSYFLRMDRSATNRGLLEASLRRPTS